MKALLVVSMGMDGYDVVEAICSDLESASFVREGGMQQSPCREWHILSVDMDQILSWTGDHIDGERMA